MEYEKYIRPRYIYLISTIYCVVLLFVYQVQFSGDSQSYISAWEIFKNGSIDMWRTPVYPFFLGVLNTLFGDAHYLLIAVIIQHIVFLISVRYLYLLAKDVIKSEIIPFFLTAFYALYPCVQTYNCFVQTETFAVVGTIFFLFSAFRLYKDEKKKHGIATFFWLLFLVFLRPSSIYLIPIMILFWSWVYIKNRIIVNPSLWFGFVGCILVGIVLSVYVVGFKRSYGLLTPSGIGIINKYCIARQACIIEPMVSSDVYRENNFKGCVFDHEVAKTMPEVFYESECAISEFGLKEFSDYVSNSISQNKFSYIKRLFVNVQRSSADRLLGTALPESTRWDVITVNLSFLFLLFIIYIILLIKSIKRKRIPCFSMLICIIALSHMFVIFFASPDDYSRLTIPVYPIFLIMIGQMIRLVNVYKSPNIEFL